MTSAPFRTKGKRSLGRKDGVAVGAITSAGEVVLVGVVVAARIEERTAVAVGGRSVEINPVTSSCCTDIGVGYGVWVG